MIGHVFISGFVQGVGFRQFVKRTAFRIDLRGWVRNLPDGRVEAKFIGEKEKIKQMTSILRKGNFLSEVKNVEVFWNPTTHSAGSGQAASGQDERLEGFEILKS